MHQLPKKEGVGGEKERDQGASVIHPRVSCPLPETLLLTLIGLKGDSRTGSWLSMKLPVPDPGAQRLGLAPHSALGERAQRAIITVTR